MILKLIVPERGSFVSSVSPSYKGHRYPVEIISHCIWLYFRFPLSFREVEELMLEREGHLQVPRKHVERIVGEDQEEREYKLGAWVGNQRSRAAALSPERMELLSAIGMRWA
ncbi:Helicase associated domain protein [Streptomyces prasinus]